MCGQRISFSIIFLLVLTLAPFLRADERILLVVTNHAQLGDSGDETGYFLSEVAHPWKVFREAGFEVVFASPDGGFAPMDPKSFDLEDPVNREFWHTLDAVEGLLNTLPLEEVEGDDFEAVFFAGGHGTMWDFPGDGSINRIVASLYERGGGIGAVCHGPAALVDVQLDDGSYLVDSKRVGGFTNREEEAVGLTETVPFLLESRLRERGATFVGGKNFQEHVVVDGQLVTGQNPASAEKTAKALVEIVRSADAPEVE